MSLMASLKVHLPVYSVIEAQGANGCYSKSHETDKLGYPAIMSLH